MDLKYFTSMLILLVVMYFFVISFFCHLPLIELFDVLLKSFGYRLFAIFLIKPIFFELVFCTALFSSILFHSVHGVVWVERYLGDHLILTPCLLWTATPFTTSGCLKPSPAWP